MKNFLRIKKFCTALLCVSLFAMAGNDGHSLVPVSVAPSTTSQSTNSPTPPASTVTTLAPAIASAPNPPKDYTVTLTRGSLRATVERLAKQFGWNIVVWRVPNDYVWVGNITIHGKDLPDIFNQILVNYPVQAIFYKGNRVLLVVPRTLQ